MTDEDLDVELHESIAALVALRRERQTFARAWWSESRERVLAERRRRALVLDEKTRRGGTDA